MTESFTPFERVSSLATKVLETSVADETEVVWFERRYGLATTSDKDPEQTPPLITVLIRVVEGKRVGWHRTGTDDLHLLEGGVRQALAVAKCQPKAKALPVLPTNTEAISVSDSLHDPNIGELQQKEARRRIRTLCKDDLEGKLSWSDTRVAVFNSHGVRRAASCTEVSFEATTKTSPGSGFAAGSARSLVDLEPENTAERARRLKTSKTPAELPSGPLPIVLTSEATTQLINSLNIFALSGHAFLEGTSFLTKHRNIQVFDRAFHLQDDGTRTDGVPFPFDLEGSVKHPLELIVKGQPCTPALSFQQGAEAGLQSTAQAIGGQDALFGNLFVLPGEAAPDDLLAACDGGLFIGRLDAPECYDPTQLHFRIRARGARAIRSGRLGPPLPDLIWAMSLLRAFARIRAIGRNTVVCATPSTPLGAISSPPIALTQADGFSIA